MRLPDLTDRELVGKAANLNDDQIVEIAKLPCGVAAVYQNECVQPVLCKVTKYEGNEQPYTYEPKPNTDIYGEAETAIAKKSLLDCIMNKEIFHKGNREDIQILKDMVIQSKLDTKVKCDLVEYIISEKYNAIESLQKLVYDFLEAGQAIKVSTEINNISEWVHSVVERLAPPIQGYSRKQIDLVVALILLEQSVRDTSYRDVLNKFTEIYKNEGGVF
jgi:hypothetical protein